MIGKTALCKETLITAAILVLMCGVSAGEDLDDEQVPPEITRQEKFGEAFSDALEAIASTPTDVSFRNDYTEIDSFRLRIVDKAHGGSEAGTGLL